MTNAVFFLVMFGVGWKGSDWKRDRKKLRLQNERLQKELLQANRENHEMRFQLSLPPARRLILECEPDPEKTISDAEVHRNTAGLAGMPMPLLLAGAAILIAQKSKKKEKATQLVSKEQTVRDFSTLKARLEKKASK